MYDNGLLELKEWTLSSPGSFKTPIVLGGLDVDKTFERIAV